MAIQWGHPPSRDGGLAPQDAGSLVYAQLTVGVVDGMRVAGGVQRGGLGRGQVQTGRTQVRLELVQRPGAQDRRADRGPGQESSWPGDVRAAATPQDTNH